jgi:hypothetical protein
MDATMHSITKIFQKPTENINNFFYTFPKWVLLKCLDYSKSKIYFHLYQPSTNMILNLPKKNQLCIQTKRNGLSYTPIERRIERCM